MRVLLVEDHVDVRHLFEHVLSTRGHEVTACADAESAWQAYAERSHELVLLDWELLGSAMDGLQLCRLIRSHPGGDRCVILMITAHDSSDALRAALQAGVNDYLVKPVGSGLLRLRLTIAEQWVESVRRRFKAEYHAQALQVQLAAHGTFHDLIGRTSMMRQLYEDILKVAAADTTVLIEGETGTGKELVARAIHLASRRASQTFFTVNCAGANESRPSRQFFGETRGTLTDSHESQQTLFDAARGGTIFLDEIGDISSAVQTTLLHILQEREVAKPEDGTSSGLDARVVVATHHDLEQDVEQGLFRKDLLYRIKVARLRLTPLRERQDDIPLLAHAFLRQFRSVMEKPVFQVSPEALQVLGEYAWPGNVRELKSTVESALIHCAGPIIQVEDLPAEIRNSESRANYRLRKRQAEQARLAEAIRQTGGNRSEAARLLGMSRRTFYRRLAQYDVPARDDPTDASSGGY